MEKSDLCEMFTNIFLPFTFPLLNELSQYFFAHPHDSSMIKKLATLKMADLRVGSLIIRMAVSGIITAVIILPGSGTNTLLL